MRLVCRVSSTVSMSVCNNLGMIPFDNVCRVKWPGIGGEILPQMRWEVEGVGCSASPHDLSRRFATLPLINIGAPRSG